MATPTPRMQAAHSSRGVPKGSFRTTAVVRMWTRLAGQLAVREDGGDDGRVGKDGEHPHGAATAGLDRELERCLGSGG